MNERSCDVVIIGAGTAGLKAYKAAVARGGEVVIVERGPGGSTCTRVGCMPSKLMIAAARMAHHARKAPDFGIVIGDVSIDAAKLWGRVRRERDRFVASVLDEYHTIPSDRVVHGSARLAGPDTVVVGDDRITARHGIVIATGARPILPDLLDPVRTLVHTHETIFDLPDLPTAIAVLGAGPLGLELAQAFARLGVDVTVLDEGDRIGGLKDPATNAAAIGALGEEVTLRLGVEVEASSTADGRARLSWADGEVVVDLVLAATGRPPALDDLALETTDLALDEHGTPEFDRGTHRSGDSNIFIAGDADAWRPVLHEAARGGSIAGDVAMGGPPAKILPALAIAFTEPALVEVGRSVVRPASRRCPDRAGRRRGQWPCHRRRRVLGTRPSVCRSRRKATRRLDRRSRWRTFGASGRAGDRTRDERCRLRRSVVVSSDGRGTVANRGAQPARYRRMISDYQ